MLTAKLIELTESTWAAIDAARGNQGRAAFIESVLWRSSTIRATGYKRQTRPAVGRYDRTAAGIKKSK